MALLGGKVVLRDRSFRRAEACPAFATPRPVKNPVVAHPFGGVLARDPRRGVELAVPHVFLVSRGDEPLVVVAGARGAVRHRPGTSGGARLVVRAGEDDVAAAGSTVMEPAVLPLADQNPSGVQDSLAHGAKGLGDRYPCCLVVADGVFDAPGRGRTRSDNRC